MSPEVATLYLQKRPDWLLQQNIFGKTPLQIAFEMCQWPILNAMLKFQPNIKHPAVKGNTVLHMAMNVDYDVLESVFEHSQEQLFAENNNHYTPMDIAVTYNNVRAVYLFQQHIHIDQALKVHARCKLCFGIDLHALVVRSCKILDNYLVPDLVRIVFAFLNL